MSELSIDEFLSDTKPKGDATEHFDLKTAKKAVVWLHPKSKIYKRNVHWLPFYGEFEDKDTKKKKMVATVLLNVCPGTNNCPACLLRKALRDNADIANDEVIFKYGEGKEYSEYNKGEITGVEGYGWMKNLAWKTEYGFGVIDNANPDEVHPYFAPKSLGKSITKVIEDQIEEDGSEKGNPFINPYAFKLSYDEDAQASDKYGASWNKAEMTAEVKELLTGPGVEIKALCDPASIARIAYLIKAVLAYDADELELDLSEADNFDPKDLQKGNNSAGKDKDKDAAKTTPPAKTEKAAKTTPPAKTTPAAKEEPAKTTPPPSGKKVKAKVAVEPSKPAAKPQEPCPECGEDIDSDAMKCPHCEAEFEEAEVIDCPKCGEEISATSQTCPHCGGDVMPF